jgi:hypothetical protein
MDISKLLAVLCCFVLIVCLTLSITTLVVLRNAVAENGALQNEAEALVAELNGCVDVLNQSIEQETSVPTVNDTTKTDVLSDAFCIREVNGKIGVYTSDGYLIRLLEVNVDTLPQKDREALKKGIVINSWRELIAIIQDYTA